MALTKIIGWLTFLIGVVIICSSLYLTYNIFTGVSILPQFFELDSSLQQSTQQETSGLVGELQQVLSEQLKNLIPLDTLTKFANLTVWTAGAWISIFGGTKLSELGIKLLSIPVYQET